MALKFKKKKTKKELYRALERIGLIIGILVAICYFIDRLNAPVVKWHIGEWVIDMEKSMPEFIDKRNRLLTEFTQSQLDEMGYLAPGESMRDVVFTFYKNSGLMRRNGNSLSKTKNTYIVEGEKVKTGFSTGISSFIVFSFKTESKDQLSVIEESLDYVVPNGLISELPPGKLTQKGDGLVLEKQISFQQKLCKLLDKTDCSVQTELYPTKYYLKKANNK
jgi:hypothetical protein